MRRMKRAPLLGVAAYASPQGTPSSRPPLNSMTTLAMWLVAKVSKILFLASLSTKPLSAAKLRKLPTQGRSVRQQNFTLF